MSSFKAIAASDLWFDILSEFSRPDVLEGKLDEVLPDSSNVLDGFGEETNNGFAAGSISWSKALKLAHPESVVAIPACGSEKSLYVNDMMKVGIVFASRFQLLLLNLLSW